MVGPGHAPVPYKLVAKITAGYFVDLADLLSANLRAADMEPQTFLDGKLVVSSSRRRVVEVQDILTWTEALTIYQLVLCNTHPHRWADTTKYKLLVIQTARQHPGQAWMDYDLAFRKDAAASGLADWSRMNLDLYNFHLRSPPPPPPRPLLQPATASSPSATQSLSSPSPICRSWNQGRCLWPFGRCRFRHVCESCQGEHTRVACPFPPSTGLRSRSPASLGRRF